MKYMLMLFEPDIDWLSVPEEKLDAVLAEHTEFSRYLQERNIPFTGEALRPSGAATTLRPDGDEVLVTDGPYVELKENLGGYYVIDVPDLDEAIAIARMCPMGSGIEVRPIWDATS